MSVEGYRWYIELGAYGKYEPNEKTFDSYSDAFLDGIAHQYTSAQIGIAYCEEDDGYIEVIGEITKPSEVVWAED